MPRNIEEKKEGWVEFKRVYFESDYIDVWVGDCNDDPNRDSPSALHLNSPALYVRLNGEDKWKCADYLNRADIYEAPKDHDSAQSFWDEIDFIERFDDSE